MTNAEKYQKSIRKIINEGSLAVHRIIGEPYNCDAIEGCDDCLFKDAADCNMEAVKWLTEDFKEMKYTYKLTRLEYEFLKNLNNNREYIFKDLDGDLTLLGRDDEGFWHVKDYVNHTFNNIFNKSLFNFIDPKGHPYKVEDILGNCEVIGDEDDN